MAPAGGELTQPHAPRSRKPFASTGDMVRSLLVVLGFAVAILVLTPRPGEDPVRVVDVSAPLADARRAAPYDVVVPAALPEDWRPTSARSGQSAGAITQWHVGYVTPDDRYAAIEQSDGPAKEFLEQLGTGPDIGGLTVDGQTWHRADVGAGGRRTLWRAFPGSTVAVTGTASWETLAALAGSLTST